MKAVPGTVYLVGAGPGDPGLITVRGLELLRSCDVVLYDRLVSPALLDEAGAGAERIFVGKKPGEVHSRQVVADALLLSKARANKSVVRLKGGDPFVFGRGGEEARLLADAGIPFEMVPGVTSAIAVPAYAGIPVTERGVASSFAVLVGRVEPGDDAAHTHPDADDAPLVVGTDTVVLLMGAAALAETAQRLIAGGRPDDQPAAAIEWGTTVKQRTVVGTLGSIAADAAAAQLKAPITTVVGDVVRAREAIAWFETRPLFGTRVVVTRPRSEARDLGDRLSALGADIVSLPVIGIEDVDDHTDLDRALKTLAAGRYDWVIFASVNAVTKTFDRMVEVGFDARAFGTTRIAAVGPATARALESRSLRPDLVPSAHTANAIASALGGGPGSILWPRVADAPGDVPAVLRAATWDVEEVACYRNVAGTPDPVALQTVSAGDYDAVTFTSASTVERFVELAGRPKEGAVVVVIGPQTAAAARSADIAVTAMADPHTTDGLVDALVRAFRNRR
ncbi:MAG: uroporphyrinogen-III C-methyltransferase [Actinomycetota bacterium]|nr:uroporphyrinogen-III C-methyltransferase [Actinomycetota bacterium]